MQDLSQHWGLANIMMVPAYSVMKRKDGGLNGFTLIPLYEQRRKIGLDTLRDVSIRQCYPVFS